MGYSLEEEYLVHRAQLAEACQQMGGRRWSGQVGQQWLAALLERLLDSGIRPDQRRTVHAHN